MLQGNQTLGRNRERLMDMLRERYLPGLFRYVMYLTNDTFLAESITLRVLKKSLPEQQVNRELTAVLYRAARAEVQACRRHNGHPVLTGLSPQDQEVLALRIGAGLDAKTAAKVLGISPSDVRAITYRSVCKLTPAKESDRLIQE